MSDFAIVNARVVLPDEVVERATVVVGNGLIERIEETTGLVRSDGGEVIDAGGALLMPGIVDVHNDTLEQEVNPRPSASLPLPFAVNNVERRLIASGVTTEFHAVAFIDRPNANRKVSDAQTRTQYLSELAAGAPRMVDHQILHRIDIRNRDALEIVFASLDRQEVRYASLDDHTPGQGQYRDIQKLHQRMQQQRQMQGGGPETTLDEIVARMERAAKDTTTVPYVYDRVRAETRRNPVTLASHDDHTPEKVDSQCAVGASVAEFPVTMEAAQRARERGMWIVVGAPNILRGGSQSGNVAAEDLIRHGLADVICADYHAPSILASVFRIVSQGLRDLPSAVRMVTRNPVRAVGLLDRGAIEPGLRADMILVRIDEHNFPHVETTITGGRRTAAFLGQSANRAPEVIGGAFNA